MIPLASLRGWCLVVSFSSLLTVDLSTISHDAPVRETMKDLAARMLLCLTFATGTLEHVEA